MEKGWSDEYGEGGVDCEILGPGAKGYGGVNGGRGVEELCCINIIIIFIIRSSCFLSCSLRLSSSSASSTLLFASHSSVTSINLARMLESSSELSHSLLFLLTPASVS